MTCLIKLRRYVDRKVRLLQITNSCTCQLLDKRHSELRSEEMLNIGWLWILCTCRCLVLPKRFAPICLLPAPNCVSSLYVAITSCAIYVRSFDRDNSSNETSGLQHQAIFRPVTLLQLRHFCVCIVMRCKRSRTVSAVTAYRLLKSAQYFRQYCDLPIVLTFKQHRVTWRVVRSSLVLSLRLCYYQYLFASSFSCKSVSLNTFCVSRTSISVFSFFFFFSPFFYQTCVSTYVT
jgi:hypothetical protein